jgi:multidrug efflux pump subunit AcrA (membrane-fusion protein)
VKLGAEADLKLNEFPGRTFPVRVTNTAVAIDTVSRAMLVELQYPNESGELLPGAYAQVIIKLTGNTGLFTIPSNAMLFRADGTTVGVVDPDGKVEIRKINTSSSSTSTILPKASYEKMRTSTQMATFRKLTPHERTISVTSPLAARVGFSRRLDATGQLDFSGERGSTR